MVSSCNQFQIGRPFRALTSQRGGALASIVVSVVLAGCGAGNVVASASSAPATVAAPLISTTAAQNGAIILSMSTVTSGTVVHYTVDGSTPIAASPIYQAPMLLSSGLTIKAAAFTSSGVSSSVVTWTSPAVASGTLVWADEFNNVTGAKAQPNPAFWTYDTGGGGWGNAELELYCGWASSSSPCNAATPNVYVGTEGYLHIVAQNPSAGVYTSARMISQNHLSVLYGRVEARIQVPEAQGLWPTFWTLGNNYPTDSWPACGELDIEERVNAPLTPDWNVGSIHGPGFTGVNLGTRYSFQNGDTAGGWQTYGMIWSPGKIAYYVGTPANVYATYTPASVNSLNGANWPFDSGNGQYLILNLAVGGNYPGNPNSSTPFPSQMLVDYVRIYAY